MNTTDKPKFSRINDPKFGVVEVIEDANSLVMTNGKFGGWVKTRDGSYVTARNRAERRAGKRL